MGKNYSKCQADEFALIKLVYRNDIEVLSRDPYKFKITISSEGYNVETKSNGLSCQLVFTYTEKYPDASPEVEIENAVNFKDDYNEKLLKHIKETINENLGTEMISLLINTAQNWLNLQFGGYSLNSFIILELEPYLKRFIHLRNFEIDEWESYILNDQRKISITFTYREKANIPNPQNRSIDFCTEANLPRYFERFGKINEWKLTQNNLKNQRKLSISLTYQKETITAVLFNSDRFSRHSSSQRGNIRKSRSYPSILSFFCQPTSDGQVFATFEIPSSMPAENTLRNYALESNGSTYSNRCMIRRKKNSSLYIECLLNSHKKKLTKS
ncbi:uncharacterized protein LOC129575860 [Sitodiplosis mosellana]|uniref:uncharacterized protein LOC129575860 n=1 Tax=Sitodiplosis mosellana TaxID=263140 RepID=UPI0024440E5A|nr:uncharacterized protein LOC129575860 [Sitodiplosis mosellana]XP_055315980.1 uncharacterized protein LOC129575860 [Sitodiplosis mosellana]